jgi:hypothetical protein
MERRHFLKARWWCGHKRHGTCLDCECCAIIIRLAATRIRCPRRRGCRTGSRYAGRPRSSQAGAGPLAPSLADGIGAGVIGTGVIGTGVIGVGIGLGGGTIGGIAIGAVTIGRAVRFGNIVVALPGCHVVCVNPIGPHLRRKRKERLDEDSCCIRVRSHPWPDEHVGPGDAAGADRPVRRVVAGHHPCRAGLRTRLPSRPTRCMPPAL